MWRQAAPATPTPAHLGSRRRGLRAEPGRRPHPHRAPAARRPKSTARAEQEARRPGDPRRPALLFPRPRPPGAALRPPHLPPSGPVPAPPNAARSTHARLAAALARAKSYWSSDLISGTRKVLRSGPGPGGAASTMAAPGLRAGPRSPGWAAPRSPPGRARRRRARCGRSRSRRCVGPAPGAEPRCAPPPARTPTRAAGPAARRPVGRARTARPAGGCRDARGRGGARTGEGRGPSARGRVCGQSVDPRVRAGAFVQGAPSHSARGCTCF